MAPPPAALSCGPVRVVFWEGGRPLAERVLAEACGPLRLPGFPPGIRLGRATIHLAPTPEVFDSLTGGRVPAWGAGVAIPSLRRIVLPIYPRGERGPPGGPGGRAALVTLRHEIAHLVVREQLPEPIPRWFDEGYATWASGGLDAAGAWRLRVAFLLGRVPPLEELELGWPVGRGEAELAYLLSATAVRHLAERSGSHAFEILLAAWRREGSLDAAIRGTYGITPGQFEAEWRRVVRRRYGWLLVFSQAAAFWALLAAALAAFYLARRRRYRTEVGALHRQEEASRAAWEILEVDDFRERR